MHRSFELVTVLSGSMDIRIGDQKYTLIKGKGVLIFPNQIHSLESEKCEHLLLIFSPETISAFSSAKSGMIPYNNEFSIPDYFYDTLLDFKEDCSTFRMKAVLYSVCDLFDRNAKYVKKTTSESELLPRIFDYIEKNFDLECTLETLCKNLGYSNAYVSRLFKDQTGISFVSFVNQYKIGKACYLLSNTKKSVLECSMECGYASLRNFNRNFKLYTGKTPNEFRISQNTGV